MATIVRVKRRRDADPLEVLHLAAKKQRQTTDEPEAASSSSAGNLFKLAGTVSSKDSGVSQKVREAIRKDKLEKEYKRHQADTLGELHTRNREQTRQSSVHNRFTVTAKHRAIALDNLDEVLHENGAEASTENGDSTLGDETEQAKADRLSDNDVCKICGKKIRKHQEDTSEDRCACERCRHKNGVDTERQSAKDKTAETEGAEGEVERDKVTREVNGTDVNRNATSTVSSDAIHRDTGGAVSGCDSRAPTRAEEMYCLVDLEVDRGPSYESLIRDSLQDQITCNGQAMAREVVSESRSEGDYVYDIYYTNDRNFDFHMFETDLTFDALGDEEAAWRPELVEDDQVYNDDDDDENLESNWRNDYPEEDPGFIDSRAMDYVYPDDMAQLGGFDTEETNHLADWMSWRCNLEDGAELSSDDNDAGQTEPTGSSYEAYYRKVKKEMGEGPD